MTISHFKSSSDKFVLVFVKQSFVQILFSLCLHIAVRAYLSNHPRWHWIRNNSVTIQIPILQFFSYTLTWGRCGWFVFVWRPLSPGIYRRYDAIQSWGSHVLVGPRCQTAPAAAEKINKNHDMKIENIWSAMLTGVHWKWRLNDQRQFGGNPLSKT